MAAAPPVCCALHQYVTSNPTSTSEPAEGLEAAALRAHAWYGEPFLHAGEDPAVALAPGTARRAALDDALAEIEAGRRSPSNRWRVRYGLMLGLERVLASPTPATAAGTDLRRHQVDALAGMLTELIAANQRAADENGNGNGNGQRVAESTEADRARRGGRRLRCRHARRRGGGAGVHGRGSGRVAALPLPPSDRVRQDDRRRGLRRGGPTPRRPDPDAPPAARLAVPARPDDGGLRRSLHGRHRRRQGAAPRQPDHDPDVRLVRASRRRALADARTSSSSATRPTPRSERRRAPRSARSATRSTSA